MMGTLDLTVVILTYNEELHLSRVIQNVKSIAREVLIVDSFSTDKTKEIALTEGARFVQNPFVNQAQQMQWALDYADIRTTWILRLDADEYLTPELIDELRTKLQDIPKDVSGVMLRRQVHFMGRWIRYGGYYPVWLLRLWRNGHAALEQRHMDEHTYLLQGKSISFTHDFIDENLNSLTWWTAKHNHYATREATDILLHHYCDQKSGHSIDGQASQKRWYKNNVYLRMPLYLRAYVYFLFRYIFRLGFLDGRQGLIWHFLQAGWYRFLVDAKITEILRLSKSTGQSIPELLQSHWGVHIKKS